MFHRILIAAPLLALLTQASPVFSEVEARKPSTPKQVFLRVEGSDHTIFEGPVYHPHARTITTPSGGTHQCDGTNDGANPTPGPTCTSALAQAAKRADFTFDGTFDSEFDDYFITTIGDTSQTSTEFWGLLVDGQFSTGGGCQTEVAPNQHILWAFNAFNAENFLGLTGSSHDAYAGQPFTATVTDIMTGKLIQGATVGDQVSDANGVVTLTFITPGPQTLKATMDNAIRSNKIVVHVLPHSV